MRLKALIKALQQIERECGDPVVCTGPNVNYEHHDQPILPPRMVYKADMTPPYVVILPQSG